MAKKDDKAEIRIRRRFYEVAESLGRQSGQTADEWIEEAAVKLLIEKTLEEKGDSQHYEDCSDFLEDAIRRRCEELGIQIPSQMEEKEA